MPTIQSYLDRHKDQGLQVLAISMDDPHDIAKVKRMAAPYSFTFVMQADVNYKSLGRIWRMPSTFVLDKNGVLQRNGHVGDATVTKVMLETLVTPLLTKP
jgi:peroxiredoxin